MCNATPNFHNSFLIGKTLLFSIKPITMAQYTLQKYKVFFVATIVLINCKLWALLGIMILLMQLFTTRTTNGKKNQVKTNTLKEQQGSPNVHLNVKL